MHWDTAEFGLPRFFPLPGHSGNSQSVLFSVIILYILLLSSSSGNWTLMNIPCVGNVCFFRIWVCSSFSFFFKTPLFAGKYFSVHKPAFTSVRIPVECFVSDILACYTLSCFRKKWMLNYALKHILSSTRRASGRLLC